MYFAFVFAALVAACLVLAKPTVEPRQAQKITVNLSQKYQTIDGFGFSGAFQRANLIVNLKQPQQQQVLDLLFNTTTGAGFSIVRNGIGSSPDSSADHMNTIEPKCPSSPSGTPSYQWDNKDSGQLFLSQQAVKYGVKTFYANAWSAPGCMKTNGNDANGGTLCGVSGAKCSSGDWRQAFADYLVQYIQLYAQNGVQVTHLGFLNEPDYTTSYASMLSSGAQSADFIKILSPTLSRANLSVAINCCDNTGWSQTSSTLSGLKSAGVESLVYAITSHEYTSRISGKLNTVARVWETEYADLNGAWTTAWYSSGGAGEGYTWANTVYNGIVNANLSAYLYWEGVQGGNTNEKLILVNDQTFTVSKRLWAFAQWRVVRPGAVRVGSSGGSNLKSAAFVNVDGSVAVVAINSGTGSQSVGVTGWGGGNATATAWVTDNSNAMQETAVTVGSDGTATATVTGRGMISFLFSGGSSSRH